MRNRKEVLGLQQKFSVKKVDGQDKKTITTKIFANVYEQSDLGSKYVDFQRPIKDIFAISTYKDIVLGKSLKDMFPVDKFWDKKSEFNDKEIEELKEKFSSIAKKLKIIATQNEGLIEDVFGSDTEKGILEKMLLVRKNTTASVLQKAEKSLVLLLNVKIKE